MSLEQNPVSGSPAATDTDAVLAQGVSKVLNSLQPVFQNEGARVRLVSIKDAVAHVEMASEACEGCGSGVAGMVGGLRLMLLERVNGLKEVVFE